MLSYIKEKLLSEPELIEQLLEHYGYANIKNHKSYISFGRSQDSSPKSITIYLHDNPNLIVKDWSKNISADIFNYIIKTCSVSFKEVISEAKRLVCIDGYYYGEQRSTAPFGGFYKDIKNRKRVEIKTYDESILNKYVACGNRRFLDDGISLEAQRYFGIGYSVVDQAITIPLYTEDGNIFAVKCRINKNPEDSESKYYYLYPGMASQSLYGYSHNYGYLESADVIYAVESEKGVLQAWSCGYKNFVGLGSGSISRKQVQMLLALSPKKIVFLHDVGFSLDSIMRNIKMIKGYSRMREIELGYWNYFGKDYEDKISATDMGKDKLDYILENEIKFVEEGN